MKVWKWMVLEAVLLLLAVALVAQTAKYTPTENQSLRLQVKQLKAVSAARDAQEAQRVAQTAYQDLLAEAGKVKAEQNWPENLIFNAQNLEFTEPSAKKEAPKP